MFANVFSPEFFVANGFSLLILLMAFIKPKLSQMWLALVLISAAVVNGVLAFKSPQLYLAFADVAVYDWYVNFIRGPFSERITLIVGIIAVLQLLTGFGMIHRGQLGKASFMAAMIFFWAIAPLGAGAAFPAPVLLAAACLVILLKWNKILLPVH